MTEDTSLENRFNEEMLGIYIRAKDECDYNATRFLQMVTEHGGLQAAKFLLQAKELSDGFVALWEHGRLDLTMEALILHSPWRALFSDDERAIAQKRLNDCGYQEKVGGSEL